jgi:formylglycine-generating enzyme required for sulfatase activity
MKLVLIPPGEFMMGSTPEQIEAARGMGKDQQLGPYSSTWERLSDELPQHHVRLTKPIRMTATEVTVGQFKAFADATKFITMYERVGRTNWRNPTNATTDDRPVTHIRWEEVVQFCNWLSRQEKLEPCYKGAFQNWELTENGQGYRLPTEAEWEFACRAGTTTHFSFGDDATELSRYGSCGSKDIRRIQPVASKLPNAFGLYDMHGNLWEFCHDRSTNYVPAAQVDPCGGPDGVYVVRGGTALSNPAQCRSAFRYRLYESTMSTDIGFRLVLPLERPQEDSAAGAKVTGNE